jgi:hypothetical protein
LTNAYKSRQDEGFHHFHPLLGLLPRVLTPSRTVEMMLPAFKLKKREG